MDYKTLRPSTQRSCPWRQGRLPTRRNRPPRRRKIRLKDAPRHTVYRKMVNGKQQPPSLLAAGIKPNRLHHHAGGRSKPRLGGKRLVANTGAQCLITQATNVNPTNAVSSPKCVRRRNLQTPHGILPTINHAQPQRIMMIENSLNRREQVIVSKPRRHLQQHRLIEPVDPPATLQ
jgi:hypothetical protein